MLTITRHQISGYETVIEGVDPSVGLHCFIAIHSTALGPALGGLRIFPYPSTEAALQDVLRLAQGMTYKSAIAEIGLGGGKSVIIANPTTQKTSQMLQAFGKVIDSLKGQYITAEDSGSTLEDMMTIRQVTSYVAALPVDTSSGDPSRFTARGVYKGMQSVAQYLWNSPSLRNKVIAIQGVGAVGNKLANILFWEGAELIVSDVNPEKMHLLHLFDGAVEVEPSAILEIKCDILAPCALGGIINKKTISKLKCRAIAGSANNQLMQEENGWQLMERGILYAPDIIINSGGIINAAAEFEPNGYNPCVSRDKTNRIQDNLLKIFKKAEREGKPTNFLANELARYNLTHGVGKRKTPIRFSNDVFDRG